MQRDRQEFRERLAANSVSRPGGGRRSVVAGEIVVHLSNGDKLTVSKEHESDLTDGLNKRATMVTLRDSAGGRSLVNTSHIVRVELRS
jgi:hypothetical protein